MSNRKSKFRAVRQALGELVAGGVDIVIVTVPSWSTEPAYHSMMHDANQRKRLPSNGLAQFFFDDVVNERNVPYQHQFLWRCMMKDLPYLYTKADVVRMREFWIRACGFEAAAV